MLVFYTEIDNIIKRMNCQIFCHLNKGIYLYDQVQVTGTLKKDKIQ